MRTMYDGVNATGLPAGGQLYAGYVDGDYPSHAALVARFPGVPVVSITTGLGDAAVADVEPGNITDPVAVANWVRRQYAAGKTPCVYGVAITIASVANALGQGGGPDPLWWIAQWDGVASLPANRIAKQFANHPGYDISVVADYWPGVDPDPDGDDMTPEQATQLQALYDQLAGGTAPGEINEGHTIASTLQDVQALINDARATLADLAVIATKIGATLP